MTHRGRAGAAIGSALAVLVVASLLGGTAPPPTSLSEDSEVYWVFAHPDDETLAAAGAMFRQRGTGNHSVIILSDGEATRVASELSLSEPELREARQREARAALGVLGMTDVTFLGLPDRGVTSEDVAGVLRPMLSGADGEVAVRGHSPLDDYAGDCGHPDHCAAGRALVQLYAEGVIDDLELYRLGHLFGGPREGRCEPLGERAMAAKQAMRAEYARRDPDEGRYGIGALSVPHAWEATETEPECRDPVMAVFAADLGPAAAVILAAAAVALAAWTLVRRRRWSRGTAAG